MNSLIVDKLNKGFEGSSVVKRNENCSRRGRSTTTALNENIQTTRKFTPLEKLMKLPEYQNVYRSMPLEVFNCFEELSSFGVIVDITREGFVKINLERLRKLNYIIVFQNDDVRFISLYDFSNTKNLIIYHCDHIPIHAINSYTLLKIKTNFTSGSK